MKNSCVASLNTARELLAHGIVGEGAEALVSLRRCAAERGCDDWRNCDTTVQGAWHAGSQQPLPEARPKPERTVRG